MFLKYTVMMQSPQIGQGLSHWSNDVACLVGVKFLLQRTLATADAAMVIYQKFKNFLSVYAGARVCACVPVCTNECEGPKV